MIGHCLLLGIGANSASKFINLRAALRHAVSILSTDDRVKILASSGLYETSPVAAPGRQPAYLNAVLKVETKFPISRLLKYIKSIEREAGRRQRGTNAARPLDIDIIGWGGRVIGWPRPCARRIRVKKGKKSAVMRPARGWLTIPHPLMHKRRFVLEPLLEVAPHWHHPVLQQPARRLLARLPRPPGQIRRILDSQWLSCDKPYT